MGWLDFLKRKQATDEACITIRDLDAARAIPRAFPGRGARRGSAAGECKTCKGKLAEVFVTTGGPAGDRELWARYPLAVDGWRCTGCGAISVPRFLEPEEVTAICKRAVEAARASDFDAAELGLRRVVTSWSEYRPARHDLAAVFFQRLRAEQLGAERSFVELALLDEIEQQLEAALPLNAPPPRLRILQMLAEAYLAREQPHRVAALIAKEREAGSEDPQKLDELERWARHRGDLYEQGVAAVEPFLHIHGKPPPALDDAARKRVRRGVECLRLHAAASPESWQALWLGAKGLQALDDHGGAVELFGRAFELQPGNPDVGREYCLELLAEERAADAVAVAKRACEAAPSDAGLVANLALAQLLAQDVAGARTSAKQAVTMDPNDPVNRSVCAVIEACASGARPVPRTLAELEGRKR